MHSNACYGGRVDQWQPAQGWAVAGTGLRRLDIFKYFVLDIIV